MPALRCEATPPARVAGADVRARIERCLLSLFAEPDGPRNDYAVMLSTRYRHLLRQGRDVPEFERLARSCEDTRQPARLSLLRLPPAEVPDLTDDSEPASLAAALEASARRLRKGKARSLPFGTGRVLRADVLRAVEEMLSLVRGGLKGAGLASAVRERFDVYRSPGLLGSGEVLFTSYATPVFSSSLRRDSSHDHPLYRPPPAAKRRLDRAAVYAGGLDGLGLEIAFLSDRWDAFRLHTEGSGFVELPGGGYLHLTYAAQNGRSFRSVGKALVRDGLFAPWEIDDLAVKRLFGEQPGVGRRYMERNPSFVFFDARRAGRLPAGGELTAGRSAAADVACFPRGMVAFADTHVPEYDDADRLAGRRRLRRFVCFQDVGGAIRGAGRVDLYQGIGAAAQRIADTMKEPGALYLLLPRGARSNVE